LQGKSLHQWGEKDGYSVLVENLSWHASVQWELAFMLWDLFVLPKIALCFALLSMVSSPCGSPWGVTILSVFSRLCWAVALASGDRDFFSQVILFWLFFGFWSLVWVFCSFLFFFLLWIGDYVCCQCTHQGEDWGPERPRTGGWLLLRVMSDWQHGVD
jgi:hypothetical protein